MKKLSSLGNEKFKSKFRHTGNFYIKNLRHNENTEVMNSVDAINEAINQSKKITFTYNHYERTNNIFQLRPKKNKIYKEISNGGLNLPRHMAEHLYMFGGESVLVILQTQDNRFSIEIKINYTAMKFWAMQFSEYVEIVTPTDLREELKNVARRMLNQYS